MRPNRKITQLTLDLVEAMANDPNSTKGLREFHQKQLEDLKRRAALQNRKTVASPFSRFEEKLQNYNDG